MFGVDLLLFGHVHAYERTNPVSNYQADASGCSPVYITIGNGCIDTVPCQTLLIQGAWNHALCRGHGSTLVLLARIGNLIHACLSSYGGQSQTDVP